MLTTAPVDAARACPASRAASASSRLSTPRVAAPAMCSARISEALPRTIVGGVAARRSRQTCVRQREAPAPTGSNTTGTPRRRAAAMARCIASTQGRLRVPMLITRAEAMPTMSSTSSTAWAMTGEAPSARRALAVEFITT